MIETTKTTQLLIHAGGLPGPLNQQDLPPANDEDPDKSVEEAKQDESFSPLHNRRRRSPRKERKPKEKKKSRSNNLGLREAHRAEAEEDPQFRVFQDKWAQKQKDTVHHRREFNSVLTLKKQLSHSD